MKHLSACISFVLKQTLSCYVFQHSVAMSVFTQGFSSKVYECENRGLRRRLSPNVALEFATKCCCSSRMVRVPSPFASHRNYFHVFARNTCGILTLLGAKWAAGKRWRRRSPADPKRFSQKGEGGEAERERGGGGEAISLYIPHLPIARPRGGLYWYVT